MHTATLKCAFLFGVLAWLGCSVATAAPLRAGASVVDVTPATLPVIVNGGFLSKSASSVHDPLHMRWLVLDDGQTRLALGVLDACLIPAEFADEIKARATKIVGLPPERIMLSATHTHSAPSLMRCLGTDADPQYPQFVMPLIVEGLRQAVANLALARVGSAVVQAPQYTHTRVWIRRSDKIQPDPFGELTVRANMHPGHQAPDAIAPSGPSDPALTLLGVQTLDGKPLAVLANFSMHYFGAPPISADYYGVFAEKLGGLLNAPAPFVGIMSQGTSGDQHWMDYSQPKSQISIEQYSQELAQIAAEAYRSMVFRADVPLAMQEKTLRLATRQPDAKRLAWAKDLLAKMGDRAPKDRTEVYAREQIWLQENPQRNIKLQAVRIGDLGIAIWPCEVFALSGLKVKAQSPLPITMNIELANAEEGYIPPPELHPLGGYNTWACRSAGLEVDAEPKIVDALLGLLEEVSGRARRPLHVAHGPYAQAVLAAKPLAYWRLEEWAGAVAQDATGRHPGAYESGIARWLDGPQAPTFSGQGTVNRCVHFAGGRLKAALKELPSTYSLELWLWNGFPNNVRPVTGYFFSRGPDGNKAAPGEHLGLGGTHSASENGRLIFYNGNASAQILTGRTVIEPRQWHHVALVRAGPQAALYLDGQLEVQGELPPTLPPGETSVFLGGRCDHFADFEGKLDEAALYDRALSAAEIAAHFKAGGLAVPAGNSVKP